MAFHLYYGVQITGSKVTGPTATVSVAEIEMIHRLLEMKKFKQQNKSKPPILPNKKDPCIGCAGPAPKKPSSSPTNQNQE